MGGSPPIGRSARSICATAHAALPELKPGWTVRYTTDLTQEVWYYLRGEEYSAQIDHFVQSVKSGRTDNVNTFRSALQADRLVGMILGRGRRQGACRAASPAAPTKGFWSRMFG